MGANAKSTKGVGGEVKKTSKLWIVELGDERDRAEVMGLEKQFRGSSE